MSGHSKWATTKHKKAVVDAKRGKLFAKLIKNVEVAARTGGGDPAGNPTLYDAIQKAKKNSVPNENIDRAARRGAGLRPAAPTYETVTYEGYAPGGVAVLVQTLTDNRNRAAADVRTALTRNGGSMADPGSVSYLFNRKGVVIVGKAGRGDRGRRAHRRARRGRRGGQRPRRVVRGGQRARPIWSPCARRCRRPGSTTSRPRPRSCRRSRSPLDEENARRVFRLIEALEDSDDVQDVYANYSVPDEIMEKLG